LRHRAGRAGARPVTSVFPGRRHAESVRTGRARAAAERRQSSSRFCADAEITLEANPGTIERGRFADYRGAGINRVSLGAQSFADSSLQQLGRIHAADDTQRAVAELRAAGIENFNLDLMYALPQQSVARRWPTSSALRLEPAHISHYQLTLEPGTVFGGRRPPGCRITMARQMQLACQQRLAAAGFRAI
jgi:coproporphyrinogen III oxidase-like Fe-S oxidoreductase